MIDFASPSWKPSLIERAHQLARSGDCESILRIKQALQSEGYSHIESHLDGGSIRRVLKALIRAAKPGEA